MEMVVTLTVLLAVVFASGDAYNFPPYFMGRTKDGFVRPPDVSKDQLNLDPVITASIKQRVDHFNPADTRTYDQRYLKSGPNASDVLFVMIGGEGAADEGLMNSCQWIVYAKRHNAVRLQVEHRYYGVSHPTKDASVANLRYLSTEQVLADSANFITVMKKKYGATKCILIGGSYSGGLVAWFRIKYPYLVDGAVASSAPVFAEFGIKEYLEVVNDALKTFDSAGSCNDAFSVATQVLEERMKTAEGRAKFEKQFKLCKPIDINEKNDISQLFGGLASFIMGVVQSNNGSSNPNDPTIRSVCEVMTNKSIGPEVDRYAKLISWLNNGQCIDFGYKDLIAYLRNETWSSPAVSTGFRPWMYQVCTEFGYFITSDSDKQPFGHLFPIKFGNDLCKDLYGLTKETTHAAINWTNVDYGGRNFVEDRVVFVNGNIDPWHSLSIITKLPRASVIFIKGTSHLADWATYRPTDPPGLISARKEITGLIDKWLQ